MSGSDVYFYDGSRQPRVEMEWKTEIAFMWKTAFDEKLFRLMLDMQSAWNKRYILEDTMNEKRQMLH